MFNYELYRNETTSVRVKGSEKRVGGNQHWRQSAQSAKAITHRNRPLVQLDVQHSVIKHNSIVSIGILVTVFQGKKLRNQYH